jgi:hypothetical protein
MNEAPIVYLVHGTFEPDAPWTKPGSHISATLREQVGAILRPFRWTGRNTITARVQGAELLKRRLTQSMDAKPSVPHFVVAHSHGGNVAIRAVSDPEVSRRIAGVVCLATPFLHTRLRSYSRSAVALLGFSASVFLCMLVLLLILWADTPHPSLYQLFFYVPPTVTAVISGWAEWARRVAKKVEVDIPVSLPLLLLRAPGDEATGVLGMAHFVGWMTGHFWYWIARPADQARRWFLQGLSNRAPAAMAYYGAVALSALVICSDVIIVLLDTAFDSGLRSVRSEFDELLEAAIPSATSTGLLALFFVGPWFLMVLVWLVLGIVTIVPLLILSVLLWPFGPELIFTAPFIETTAEPTPSGKWTLVNVGSGAYSVEDGLQNSALWHSLHSNPDAIREVAKWIEERASHTIHRSPEASDVSSGLSGAEG